MRTVEELDAVQPRDVPPEAWMKAIAIQLALLNDVAAAIFFSFQPELLSDTFGVTQEEDEATETNSVPIH